MELNQRLETVKKYSNYLPKEETTKSHMVTKSPNNKYLYKRYRLNDDERFDMNTIKGETTTFERGLYTYNPLPLPKVQINPGGGYYPRNVKTNYIYGKETNIHAPWASRFGYGNYPNEYGQGYMPGDYKDGSYSCK